MFDLSGHRPGPLMAIKSYPGNVTRKAAYYLHPELASEALFGVVEIKLDDDFYDSPPAFVVEFEARKERLKYYVVARGTPTAR